MKTVETKLYRYSELVGDWKANGKREYDNSFLCQVIPIEDIWFTSTGLIYPIFNT